MVKGEAKQGGESANSGIVLAIDPGSAKCGLAVVRSDFSILDRAVVPTEELLDRVQLALITFRPDKLVLGTGTGGTAVRRELEDANLPVPLLPVEESHTSEAARARYLAETPLRGWQRFLPRSLRTPPEPYDDWVAVILAERYWRGESTSHNTLLVAVSDPDRDLPRSVPPPT